MFQIRWGLENNLNVFLYANSSFSWHQMKEIREGLEDDLDVSIYANPEIPAWEMEETRKKLFFAEKNNLIDFFV